MVAQAHYSQHANRMPDGYTPTKYYHLHHVASNKRAEMCKIITEFF